MVWVKCPLREYGLYAMCHSAVVAGNSLGSVCSGVLFEVILAGRNEEVDANHPPVIECQVRPRPPPPESCPHPLTHLHRSRSARSGLHVGRERGRSDLPAARTWLGCLPTLGRRVGMEIFLLWERYVCLTHGMIGNAAQIVTVASQRHDCFVRSRSKGATGCFAPLCDAPSCGLPRVKPATERRRPE